jgi:hypothetical protein
MFKLASLSVYRRLLILVMLTGALFVFSLPERTLALPCCGPLFAACNSAHSSCVSDCHVYMGVPAKYAQCVDQCDKGLLACQAAAQPCDSSPSCP